MMPHPASPFAIYKRSGRRPDYARLRNLRAAEKRRKRKAMLEADARRRIELLNCQNAEIRGEILKWVEEQK